MHGRGTSGEWIVGAAILVFAGIVIWQAGEIAASPLYAQVGPKFVPYLVGIGLALLGAALCAAALSGRWRTGPDEAGAIDRGALAWLAGGMALNCILIGPAGFIVASTVMFACVARAFAARNWAVNLGIGLAIALGAYLAFDRLLGININAGLLEGWL
jgi:putative tricarboxylic transport membrane protein